MVPSYDVVVAGAVPAGLGIARGLGEGMASEEIARRAWRIAWTPELLRMRRFHLQFGKVFGYIGIRTLTFFMKNFFNMPGDVWRLYLSNDCTILGIDRALARGILEKARG